mmetsp:Transcript_19586/g.40243  ORF Transcript_19586/g.40243 Transcript_19586/m.40243 type:complete len:155 (-) Transcript_19586:236-700(-)
MKYLYLMLSLLSCSVAAFSPQAGAVAKNIGNRKVVMRGWFENLFGGGGQAEASHILIKGGDAEAQCNDIKKKLEASAGGNSAKLQTAFAASARQYSTCPSKNSGGSLGSFGPGQMVPEFDKVVFNEDVGVVHGPIKTQFGSHLILITDRDEPKQ